MGSTLAGHSSDSRTGSHRAARSKRADGLTHFEIATLIAIALLIVIGILSAHSPGSAATASLTVQARPGDTLWSIARNHPIAGLTTAQIAEQIARDNHLTGSTLQVGSVLVVPAPGDPEQRMASL
jgi:LysM repeat protein